MTPRAKAMDFLARREYGFKELCLRLSQYFDSDVAEEAVIVLRQEGLQSDARYTQALVNRRVNQGYGPNYIRRELVQRGIDADIVTPILANYDWGQQIFKVVAKQNHKTSQKLQNYLQYKGYDFDLIKQVIEN